MRNWKISHTSRKLLCAVLSILMISSTFCNFKVFADSSAAVSVSTDAAAMAQSLLGSNSGFTISNAVYSGASGSAGTFSNAASQVGFDSGIVLSTGYVSEGGDNIFSGGYSEDFDGDTISADVDDDNRSSLISYGFPSTNFNDLCMLSFDINAQTSGYISFQYCVASEEYPEYTDYADQFVLCVNGVNYALIPNSSTGVSIGTVNHDENTIYYKGLTQNDETGVINASGAISTTDFVFDGETVVFSVSAPVVAGSNHIVLAIADLTDSALDSAVFIKAGSIKSGAAQPGTFKIGDKTDGTLEITRENGSDGYAGVDVSFEDAGGNTISTSTASFNDGQTSKTVNIPDGAVEASLSNATGGAGIDSSAETAMLVSAAAPAVSSPSGVTVNKGSTASFTVTAFAADGGSLTYQWQKSTNGGSSWSDISGATAMDYTTGMLSYSDDGAEYRCNVTNTLYGTTASTVSKAAVLTVNSLAKTVSDKIDALPDPDTAADGDITNAQQDITDTKELYDGLDDSGRNVVGAARKTKLNKLINRLNALLVIVSEDQSTGIACDGIGTSVLVPELNDENVGKVKIALAVDPVTIKPTSSSSVSENIGKAMIAIEADGQDLVAAYDISLIKSIYGSAGSLLSSGKVSNSDIVDTIAIDIPIPEGYSGRTDLTVVYIDDSGNVTPLATSIVTIDGVQYLEFQASHFSEYAIVADTSTSSVSNPKTGDVSHSGAAQMLASFGLIGALLAGTFVLRKKVER